MKKVCSSKLRREEQVTLIHRVIAEKGRTIHGEVTAEESV